MICLVQLSFSQSEFLVRGKSGIVGSLGFSTNRESNGMELSAGYSYRGFLDASLNFSKANKAKIRDGVLTPRITFYPLKQEDAKGAPSLGISIGFSHYTSKKTETVIVPDPDSTIINWRSYQRTTELTINAVKLGITAQRRMAYWKVFTFQPTLGAVLSVKKSGWEFTIRGGVAIVTRVVRGPLLILTPSIERQSGVTTLLLTFGALL
jgi:hypothetical protein